MKPEEPQGTTSPNKIAQEILNSEFMELPYREFLQEAAAPYTKALLVALEKVEAAKPGAKPDLSYADKSSLNDALKLMQVQHSDILKHETQADLSANPDKMEEPPNHLTRKMLAENREHYVALIETFQGHREEIEGIMDLTRQLGRTLGLQMADPATKLGG